MIVFEKGHMIKLQDDTPEYLCICECDFSQTEYIMRNESLVFLEKVHPDRWVSRALFRDKIVLIDPRVFVSCLA